MSQLAVKKKGPAPIIEFTTEAQDDINEGINFGDTPVRCSCPHCERSVITFIDHEASWVTWLLGFIVWISLGWMAFWVLPLLWPAFKDVVHHCPQCLNVIERRSRMNLPSFKSEIMTFKIGGCAVVLARKYVMILCALAGVIGTVYVLRTTVHLEGKETIPKGPMSNLTWDNFAYDCGPRTSLRNRASTAKFFEDKYRRRTFKWEGEVSQIREGIEIFFLKTKSVVMIRMDPPRYPRREIPDIALLFGEDRNVEVAELTPGDWVEFEATMTAHGHRGDPEVMVLWHIGVTTRPTKTNTEQASLGDAVKLEAVLGELLGGEIGRSQGGGFGLDPLTELGDLTRQDGQATLVGTVAGDGKPAGEAASKAGGAGEETGSKAGDAGAGAGDTASTASTETGSTAASEAGEAGEAVEEKPLEPV